MGSGSKPKDPKPTAQEKALAQVGAEQWNDYVDRYVPVHNAYLDEIRATDIDRDAAAGAASADVALAFKGDGLGKGVPSDSGKSIMGGATHADAYGDALGTAQGKSVQNVDDTEITGLNKFGAFGRKLTNSATVALSTGARIANNEAIASAKAKFAERNAASEAFGTGVGLYAGYKEDSPPGRTTTTANNSYGPSRSEIMDRRNDFGYR